MQLWENSIAALRALTVFILPALFLSTACAPSEVIPTPTAVLLDLPTPLETEAAVLPAATPIPLPSITPTATPFPTATPAPLPADDTFPTPTSETTKARVEIIAAGLNVRQGPGLVYGILGAVSQGQSFDVTGLNPGKNWLQINLPDGPGWIASQSAFVRVTGSLDHVPVVAAPAAGSPSSSSEQTVANQTAPETRGQLVFTTGSGGDLYVINADGTGLRRLAGPVIDPVVSPDGRQVAFTRWEGSKWGGLYTISLDGGEARVILGDIRQPKSPAWSPDGQEIVVSFQHGGTVDPKPECRTFDADDGFQLPNVSEITSVRQKSNGELEICFIRIEDLQWGLRRIKVATGQFEDLPADLYSFNPTWDPQNPWRLIYDGQRGLMQLDLVSGDLQPFTSDVRDTAPVFSPDGQKLALTYKQHDHWEVYTFDLASGSRQRLTKPPLLATPQYNSAAPAWSPDGSHIAFMTDRTGRWEIWLMNADGSNQRPLFGPDVQAQLDLAYRGVNERMLNWVAAPVKITSAEVPAGASPASSEQPADPSNQMLAGMWDFGFGSMVLTQENRSLSGAYGWYGGADAGQIKGNFDSNLRQFQGVWLSARSPNRQGFLRGQLNAEQASFSGAFEGNSSSQPWCGVRAGQPLPTDCGFSGFWQLRFGNPPGVGQATLTQTGATVEGTFVDSQGQPGEILNGVVTVQSLTEATLSGLWRNAQGEQDSFEWRLNLSTGRTFQGRRAPGNSEWCGWRQGSPPPTPCGF